MRDAGDAWRWELAVSLGRSAFFALVRAPTRTVGYGDGCTPRTYPTGGREANDVAAYGLRRTSDIELRTLINFRCFTGRCTMVPHSAMISAMSLLMGRSDMSEVVSHGSEYPRNPEAWIGKKVTCMHCGCIFQITKDTSVRPTDARKVRDGWYVEGIPCPECRFTMNKTYW